MFCLCGCGLIFIDNGHLNPPYDDLHSANRMALMTEAAVNLAAAMRIGQQQNQHQQNNQQNSQQQHQVSCHFSKHNIQIVEVIAS